MNSILDDNMTSLTLVQLRQKLLDNGFLRTYGDDRELTVEKSDDIKVKVTLSPGLNVQTKTPTLGNPVQIFATIATLICSWVFAGGAIGIIGAVAGGILFGLLGLIGSIVTAIVGSAILLFLVWFIMKSKHQS